MKKRSKSRRPRKSSKPRRTSKNKSKKKRFGGYTIDFTNRHELIVDVFGNKPITPAQMTKKLWAFIKKMRLGGKN